MFKNTSRALRRHHRARLINKYSHYERIRWYDVSVEDRRHRAALTVDHIVPCSCDMCGNPRKVGWEKKWDQLTMQEKKAYYNFKDQEEDS